MVDRNSTNDNEEWLALGALEGNWGIERSRYIGPYCTMLLDDIGRRLDSDLPVTVR